MFRKQIELRSQVDSLEGILKKRRKRQAGAKEDVTRVRMC